MKKFKTIKNEGVYKFTGFVDERLLCISYKTTIKGLHSSGSIVVQSDSSGKVLTGTWSGIGFNSISNAPYEMIKISESTFIKKNTDEIISIAINYLDENKRLDFRQGVCGKTRMMMTAHGLLSVPIFLKKPFSSGNINIETKHKKNKRKR